MREREGGRGGRENEGEGERRGRERRREREMEALGVCSLNLSGGLHTHASLFRF